MLSGETRISICWLSLADMPPRIDTRETRKTIAIRPVEDVSTRNPLPFETRKLGEEDVRGQNDDPCVDHLREWMQKKNKKNKRKDIFQKRKRIKEEEEEKKRGKRNV